VSRPKNQPLKKEVADYELVFECAPLGKLARVAHHHLSEKHLPAAFSFYSMASLIPGVVLACYIAQLKCMQQFVTSPVIVVTVNLVLIAILIPLMKILLKPTHVGFSTKGVRWLWKRTIPISGKHIRWEYMQKISLIQPDQTARAEQLLLSFRSAKREVRIPVNEIESKHLPVIYDCIKNCAPNVERDPAVAELLGADEGNSSYTELWLSALTAPPERTRMTPLTPGARLHGGEYLVGDRLGAGGQGVAYLATRNVNKDTVQTVVLKEYIMPVEVSQTARRQAVEKLQHEAQILEKINHPQIVKLIDLIFEDHRGYLVLEHIDGAPLSRLVRERGPVPEETAAKLAMQMCTILAHLHSLDPPVIHRDFTPDNLILNNSGLLKLIDFNVAEQKRTTTTATVVGKHAYIAPEQFRGHPVPQSDLYSLGATLSFLLTGHDPKPISVSHPKQKKEGLSEAIDAVVARCTAIDTKARFESAQQIDEALKQLLSAPTLS
jgi:hypothetical protein